MGAIDTIRRDEPHYSVSVRRKRANYLWRFLAATVSFKGWVDRLLEKRRGRQALLEMTDEQLKDIGVSRTDAYREGQRPFWG